MGDYINLFEQTISEAYIGKTDTLLQVEEQFNIMKSTLKRGQDINAREEVQKLNRLIEKQFGMDVFSLRIDQSNQINAYTEVIGTKFDLALEQNLKNLIIGSQDLGYRFKPNNKVCVITTIYLGLIMNPDITGEELTGCLLHEIGHNFADCLDENIRLANKKITRQYYEYLIWKASLLFGRRKAKKELQQNTSEYQSKESEKQQKNKTFRGWLKGLAAIKYNFKAFTSEVLGRLAMAAYQPKKMTKKEAKEAEEKVLKSTDRRNEVFADKFAAVYGYGTAQASILYKMETTQSSAAKFIDKFFGKGINDTVDQIFQNYYLYDPHPQVVQRVNAMIKTLKNELSKEDLDPKVKQIIKTQLDEMEKIIQEITTATKNDTEREAVRKAFYKAVNENSPDAVTEEFEKEIEKELDEGLRKNLHLY